MTKIYSVAVVFDDKDAEDGVYLKPRILKSFLDKDRAEKLRDDAQECTNKIQIAFQTHYANSTKLGVRKATFPFKFVNEFDPDYEPTFRDLDYVVVESELGEVPADDEEEITVEFPYAYVHDACGKVVFYGRKKFKKDEELSVEDVVYPDGNHPNFAYEIGPTVIFNQIALKENVHFPICHNCYHPITNWPKLKE